MGPLYRSLLIASCYPPRSLRPESKYEDDRGHSPLNRTVGHSEGHPSAGLTQNMTWIKAWEMRFCESISEETNDQEADTYFRGTSASTLHYELVHLVDWEWLGCFQSKHPEVILREFRITGDTNDVGVVE